MDVLETPLETRLRAKLDGKTKPQGALGRIEEIALQIGLIQGRADPVLRAPTVLLFAADHGAAEEGVSAFPQAVTAQMVANFYAGGAAINVFARCFGLRLTVVDAGVKALSDVLPEAQARADTALDPLAPRLVRAAIAPGTRNYVHAAAMSAAQCAAAIELGRTSTRKAIAQGTTLLMLGEMGIGNTASAALLMHRLTDVPLAACVGRGTGLDDAGLARKHAILTRANARVSPDVVDPHAILAEFGGFEIAALVGAFLEATAQRCAVLVDGFIVSVAALVAIKINEEARHISLFSHASEEQGHQRLLETLGAKPLLALGLRLGEGSGAALAYPLVQAAVAMLNEMASFAGAGVAERV